MSIYIYASVHILMNYLACLQYNTIVSRNIMGPVLYTYPQKPVCLICTPHMISWSIPRYLTTSAFPEVQGFFLLERCRLKTGVVLPLSPSEKRAPVASRPQKKEITPENNYSHDSLTTNLPTSWICGCFTNRGLLKRTLKLLDLVYPPPRMPVTNEGLVRDSRA